MNWRTLIPIAGLVALFGSAHASASILRCASQELSRSEQQQVLGRARRMLGRERGPVKIDSACWNRDFAHAWVQTPTVTDAEGVRTWWATECRRERFAWSCEPAQETRRLDLRVAMNGQPARISVALPPGLSTESARSLVLQSAGLAGNASMPLKICGAPYPEADVAWQRSRPAPERLGEDPAVAVSLTDTGTVVDYLRSIRFHFGPDAQPECWEELLVVD